jgi:protein phosphatase
METVLTELGLQSAGLSHAGHVREENQDAIRLVEHFSPHGYLYALADGMGGYAQGGQASQHALETLCNTFYAGSLKAPTQNLKRSIEAANLAVYQLAQTLQAGRMGTTLTAVNLIGNRLHLAHVGDSRAYLVHHQRARCLTQDHTLVGDMVRSGVLTPDKIRTHSRRSVLNKSLGTELFVQPDLAETTVHADDTLILCSDGVWSVIQDDEFAQYAGQYPNPAELNQALIDLALHRQSDDNVSVVAVRIKTVPHSVSDAKPTGMLGFLRRLWPGTARQIEIQP